MDRRLFWATALVLLGTPFCVAMAGEPAGNLPDVTPQLPKVTARAYPIDPAKGYAVRQLKPDTFMMTDGGYQCMFVPTGKGVVLFDAPPSMSSHIIQAVASVTPEPIVELIYSHSHVDHIGGAGLLKHALPGLKIVAEEGTSLFLRRIQDPDRPVPTEIFADHETLKLGSLHAELKVGYWHSSPGDLFIYLPDRRILMAVDAFSAGSVPFMGLDLTQNVYEYLRVFDRILAYDADIIIPGHHNNPANRQDVELAKAYADDVYQTAKRVEQAGNAQLVGRAVEKYGRGNTYATASVLIDREVDDCATELTSRWSGRLDDVDVWARSHCRTALVYAEWDVGPHGKGL